MIRTVLLLLTTLLASAAAVASDSSDTPDPALRSFVMFSQAYAHQLRTINPGAGCKDLAFLGKMVGGARIVGLGESRQGAHEFLQLKRRMVECLVMEQGFTHILIEAGLPYTRLLNRYVQDGKGNAESLVSGMEYWSLYDNDEFIGLLDWLKEYNAGKAKGKVQLLGIDMQDPGPGLSATIDYLKTVDGPFVKRLLEGAGDLDIYRKAPNVVALAGLFKKMDDTEFSALSAKLSMVDERLAEKKADYIARSSATAYNVAVEDFHTVLLGHQMYALGRDKSFGDLFEAREKALEKNVEWQVAQAGDGARFILLSNNNQVAKSALAGTSDGHSFSITPLGMALEKDWPGKYVALGAAFYASPERWHAWQQDAEWSLSNAPPGSVGQVLGSTGDALFVVDFADLAPGSLAKAWSRLAHPMRSEDALYLVVPADAFDGLLFVRTLTQAHFTDGAVHRLEAMGPPLPALAQVDQKSIEAVAGKYRLKNKSVVEMRVEQGRLYAYWNRWKFRVYATGDNDFLLRSTPEVSFRFTRRKDGSVEAMQIRSGDKGWEDTTRVD